MAESNTRKYWRSRIRAIAQLRVAPHGEWDTLVEGWLDDLMRTPELSLAELAESNPDYRLAVVNARPHIRNAQGDTYHCVVKMEERNEM